MRQLSPTPGQFTCWYSSRTSRRDVRNGDPTTVDGLELLLQWTFQPSRRPLN